MTNPADETLMVVFVSHSMKLMRHGPILLFAWLTATALGCAPDTVANTAIELEPFTITGWSHPTVMRGTSIIVTGTGFLPPELGSHRLRLDGSGVALDLELTLLDDSTLGYVVDDEFLGVLPSGSTFQGTMTIVRILTETGDASSAQFPATIQVVDILEPSVTGFESDDGVLYPGDIVTIRGDGFLLKGEGHTVVVLLGTMQTKVPPETRLVHAVLPLIGTDRNTIHVELTPDILGIRPGHFEGGLTVFNEAASGNVREGAGLPTIAMDLQPPRIDAVEPPIASRGQRITAHGRGFLPTDPFYEATTLIRLEGAFTASRTSRTLTLEGPSALALFPDSFEGNRSMDYILRVTTTPSGERIGLGLIAGGFTGTISPMLISGTDTIIGPGVSVQLTVAPQRQVVFVNFIPGFSTTVAEMGLAVVEAQIRQRVLDVCARDYQGINIEFRDIRPTDFAEYSIVEVGGADPNDAGLFGLDNTKGKDVGNLRFNDVIGGTNAETREQGYYAFGGVFVRSFFQLSPSIPGVDPLPIASPRFDDLFGPFMPSLGGTVITPDELGGSRQAAIDVAVMSLGNLVGTTVVHEIGHSLGLANIEGQFHNSGDNPGWIMDSGNFRPFEERVEIDGQGPGFFSPNNRNYLEMILPIQ